MYLRSTTVQNAVKMIKLHEMIPVGIEIRKAGYVYEPFFFVPSSNVLEISIGDLQYYSTERSYDDPIA